MRGTCAELFMSGGLMCRKAELRGEAFWQARALTQLYDPLDVFITEHRGTNRQVPALILSTQCSNSPFVELSVRSAGLLRQGVTEAWTNTYIHGHLVLNLRTWLIGLTPTNTKMRKAEVVL